MQEFWFTPKKYGYGATPINAKGWALVVGFIVLIVSGCLLIDRLSGDKWTAALGSMTYACALTFIFIIICRRKTDGPWRWRWG
jgi:hypothetical protein